MDCSVIICTYNRAASLNRCLTSFGAIHTDPQFEWELIVIDNACTDQTRDVCFEHGERLPLRYVHEPREGKSVALNTAISFARGELLLMIDDDVTVTPHWMDSMVAASNTYPQATHFGGAIIPKWQRPAPKWVTDNLDVVGGMVGYYARSETVQLVNDTRKPFFGANLGFRASALRSRSIGFSEKLGIVGGRYIGGEEQTLQTHLIHSGGQGIYSPEAVVHHWTPNRNVTEKYLRRWYFRYGRLEALLGELPEGKTVAGIPRYLFRDFFTHTQKFFLSRYASNARNRIIHEARMAQALGSISYHFKNFLK